MLKLQEIINKFQNNDKGNKGNKIHAEPTVTAVDSDVQSIFNSCTDIFFCKDRTEENESRLRNGYERVKVFDTLKFVLYLQCE